MNEEKDVLGEAAVGFLKMIGAFAALGFSIAFGGYVVMFLWNGVIPQTFGLPLLTWGQATGLDVVVSFIVMQKQPNNDNETILSTFISVLSINLMFMLIGWIVMMFI